MKVDPAFGFIRLNRGILTPDEFVELNRKLLAKLLIKNYQVFTSYKHISSSSVAEEAIYFVIDQKNKGELVKYLQMLKLEFQPELSAFEGYGRLPPDSVMGKWTMSLISKS